MSILGALGRKKSGLQNRNLYSKIGSISFVGSIDPAATEQIEGLREVKVKHIFGRDFEDTLVLF